MTPEAERDFLDLLEGGTMPLKRRALLRAVWEEIVLLRTLERTFRTVVEDEDYGAGGLGHHEDCHINYARGSEKPKCDCYVKDVMAALKALDDPNKSKGEGDQSALAPCMSYCRLGYRHEGECQAMKGR